MMSYKSYFCALIFALVWHAPAHANDSTGWVSTGGLGYFQNPEIRMVSEDLFISTAKVRVAYEFVNDGAQDRHETVLFPLPAAYWYPDMDFADVRGLHDSFKIWVNDVPVVPTQHTRVLLAPSQKDITTDLANHCGIHFSANPAPEFNLIDDCVQKIAAPNAAYAQWQAQVVYSWQQTFPAQKTLRVRHEYAPLVGGSVYLDWKDAAMKRDYCFDPSFLNKLKARSSQSNATYQALGYILTTGANWAKPIERFHLTLEKPAGSLMSLCWDQSLQKISDTRFEAYKTHFTPKRDIQVLFAHPYSSN